MNAFLNYISRYYTPRFFFYRKSVWKSGYRWRVDRWGAELYAGLRSHCRGREKECCILIRVEGVCNWHCIQHRLFDVCHGGIWFLVLLYKVKGFLWDLCTPPFLSILNIKWSNFRLFCLDRWGRSLLETWPNKSPFGPPRSRGGPSPSIGECATASWAATSFRF